MSLTILHLSNDPVTPYTSYASVAEANERLRVDVNRRDAWNALMPDDKVIHLISATNRLDYYQYVGQKVDSNQQAQWPRNNVVVQGIAYPNDDVPQPIAVACILLAGTIVVNPQASTIRTNKDYSIKSVKAGDASTEFYHGNSITENITTLENHDNEAHALIVPFLATDHTGTTPVSDGGAGLGLETQFFGGGQESFNNQNFNRSEGF